MLVWELHIGKSPVRYAVCQQEYTLGGEKISLQNWKGHGGDRGPFSFTIGAVYHRNSTG